MAGLVDRESRRIVEAIRRTLEALERSPGPATPLGDVGWLRLRGEDERFPGLIEPRLCAELGSLVVRV